MNINQSLPSSLSRSTNDPLHEQHIIKEDSHFERSITESYHHPSYEYLSSVTGGGNNNQIQSSHHQTSSSSYKYPNKYTTSSSYSPTSHRYPPTPIIDESTLNNYSVNRPTQLQPSSTNSLSPHVVQHNNTNNMNRHSLLPTASDDSGNESSINYQQQINNNTHFVVVAIDFGTTFSGYAFAFTRDIDSILMMRKVDGNDPGSFLSLVAFFFLYQYLLFVSVVLIGVINQKTPTTILLTPNLEFHSFGFFARDFFHDLDPDEAKRWLYFEKFKMHLHYTQVRIELFLRPS